jgi:hypothetical protein
MPIDLEPFTEQELRDLHHRIVERLRLMQQVRAHGAMMHFSIGDRVYFHAGDGRQVGGVLVKYNRKSVTVIDDGGLRWTVSPTLLVRVETQRPAASIARRPAELPSQRG